MSEFDFSKQKCRGLIVHPMQGPAFTVEANSFYVDNGVAYCYMREWSSEKKPETQQVRNPNWDSRFGSYGNRFISEPTGKEYDHWFSETFFVSLISNFVQIEPIFEGEREKLREDEGRRW